VNGLFLFSKLMKQKNVTKNEFKSDSIF